MEAQRSYLGHVVQTVAAVAVGTAPVWISDFLADDSPYRYLLSFEPITICLIGIGIAVVLAPQLLRLTQVVFRNLAAALFFGVYATRRHRYAPVALAVAASSLLAVGLSNLFHGASALGYSLGREAKYAARINRQHLIMQANAEEEAGGVGASYDTLKQIVAIYPQASNWRIEEYLGALDSARELSAQVYGYGVQYRDDGNVIIAAEAFDAALRIWPHNAEARDGLARLEGEVKNASDQFRSLHAACRGASPFDRQTIEITARFVLREPQPVLARLGDQQALGDPTRELICEEAVGFSDFGAYLTALMARFRADAG